MKTNPIILTLILFSWINLNHTNFLFGQGEMQYSDKTKSDDVVTFKNLLNSLCENSTNELFALHFQSMINVIDAKGKLTSADSAFIEATLPVFSDLSVSGNASLNSSYLDRLRPLIIAWVSPTDGAVSFVRMKLPEDWNPEKTYPLYIELHGLSSSAPNPIEYMTSPYRKDPSTTFAFEEGYHLSPWGRGNLWYQGISETDIWEGIDVIENLVRIDPSRMYLAGHSMGGYGTWFIASKSANVWAAIGIHAGALWYGTDNMLSDEKIQNLKETPTYFVVGTNDGLYNINLSAYNLLQNAGNENINFVTFTGAHEYLNVNVENMYLWLKEFENEDFTSFKDIYVFGGNEIRFYPNPVLSETIIHLKLFKRGNVTLNIFDINGKMVANILDKNMNAGEIVIPWTLEKLASGIYTYSLEVDRHRISGKLVLQ